MIIEPRKTMLTNIVAAHGVDIEKFLNDVTKAVHQGYDQGTERVSVRLGATHSDGTPYGEYIVSPYAIRAAIELMRIYLRDMGYDSVIERDTIIITL